MAPFSLSVDGQLAFDKDVLGSIGMERGLASSRPKCQSMVLIYDFWKIERVCMVWSHSIARPRSHKMIQGQ